MFLAAGASVSAQSMMGDYQQNTPMKQNQALNSILLQIYKGKNISGADKLDCGKITDVQFVEMGVI